MCAAKKGFTLVELLVVISIIALLLSILMPSLGRAREKARIIQCLSNMRTAGVAANLYSNEYNDRIVPACIARFTSYDVTFEVLLDKYINVLKPGFPNPYIGTATSAKSSGIWQCPSDRVVRNKKYNVQPGRVPHIARSYTMNLLVSQYYGTFNSAGKSAKVQNVPSRVAMMGELWNTVNLLREDVFSASVFTYAELNLAAIYGQTRFVSHDNGRKTSFLKMDLSAESLDYIKVGGSKNISGWGPYGGYYYDWNAR